MASGRDDDRLLAEIERLLAREDPGLDARMSALARQLTEDPAAGAAPHGRTAREDGRGTGAEEGEHRAGRDERRDWRKVLALVAVVVAVVGLVLTAILTQPSGSGAGTTPGSPAGLSAVAVPRA
jgi:cytochrome c-type biogenesis protein CcmH/NrfG